eukprot:TRINITY_DN14795_c0_g1_i1.p1 TRINITY_DN14795_c0_g1~~TRINITY_DN14795_c0_g1_i1.p1  ORF type:complete len:117 (-),score=19.13 TRINITY_DN14795_c0_g1_i1:9-359(-)
MGAKNVTELEIAMPQFSPKNAAKPVGESIEIRRKRLKIRAWRRGIKEMDLLIGGYADAHLADMDAAALDEFETLMDEHDQDLLSYATGLKPVPEHLKSMLERVIADADHPSWGLMG